MESNAFLEYIDTAQVALYGFWAFFFGLIWYLHREDKREGYPLDTHRVDRDGNPVTVEGLPPVPCPKTFKLADGSTIEVPRASAADRRPIAARQVGWDDRYGQDVGAPLEPTGDPMKDGVGPAAYAERADQPERMLDGSPPTASGMRHGVRSSGGVSCCGPTRVNGRGGSPSSRPSATRSTRSRSTSRWTVGSMRTSNG